MEYAKRKNEMKALDAQVQSMFERYFDVLEDLIVNFGVFQGDEAARNVMLLDDALVEPSRADKPRVMLVDFGSWHRHEDNIELIDKTIAVLPRRLDEEFGYYEFAPFQKHGLAKIEDFILTIEKKFRQRGINL